MKSDFDVILVIAIVTGALLFYFIPSFIASNRKHKSKGGIIALNILMGWTFLGWVIALVWSLSYTHNNEAR